MDNLQIRRIEPKEAQYDILYHHYAHRLPSISFAYGLFNDKGLMLGVLTIGKPASNSLCEGVLGKDYAPIVYELNRLYTRDNLERNVLSYFVGGVLKDMKEKKRRNRVLC